MDEKKYAIGLDNGGTVTKAALFDFSGHELQVVSRKTQVVSPRPGYNERDMESVWEANCACIRELLKKSGIDSGQVAGVAVCGHGKGLYLWGKDGKPARAGISSTDNRAWKIAEEWRRDGTWQAVYPQICQQLMACQQATLLRWVKENDPRVYENIKWVFSVKDYIRFRLTGEAWCEITDISGSGLMDIKNRCYDQKLLERLGIGEIFECLAPIKYSFEQCGSISPEAAEKTGLKPGTPVAGGMFDVDACGIAMAVTRPEHMCTITGTWSINECIFDQPVTKTPTAMNSLYAIPGYYLLEECSATSAGNLDWAMENAMNLEGVPASERYDALALMAGAIAPEKSDVYYLPFLYGSNAHPLAKAAFVGMTNYHTKAHMARAVYEGVAFSHRRHIEKLLSARTRPAAIRMGGGAVHSPFWVQMFADVLGIPIETVTGVSELGALGCAMAVSVASGIYRDYDEAAQNMVRICAPVDPDMEKYNIYTEKFGKYMAISNALDHVWDAFAV